jgi:hypothetical protein
MASLLLLNREIEGCLPWMFRSRPLSLRSLSAGATTSQAGSPHKSQVCREVCPLGSTWQKTGQHLPHTSLIAFTLSRLPAWQLHEHVGF